MAPEFQQIGKIHSELNLDGGQEEACWQHLLANDKVIDVAFALRLAGWCCMYLCYNDGILLAAHPPIRYLSGFLVLIIRFLLHVYL